MTPHYDDGVLLKYLQGALTEEEQRAVDTHLEACAPDRRCNQAMERLARAPVVRQSVGDVFRDPAWKKAHAADLLESGDRQAPPARQRYVLVGEPMQGGIGQVWRAKDTHLGREVALKELRTDRVLSAELRARFLAEAQINAQLTHPNIVPTFELVQQAGVEGPFYTMQFVEGQTLSEAVRDFHARRQEGKAGILELRQLLTSFATVCKAVDYAHDRGVLHRDLTGLNVILGKHGEVFLLDWGMAKLVGDIPAGGGLDSVVLTTMGADTETQPGAKLGTPAYMAPEQAAGKHEQIDRRTDVYALGVILFEILTGRLPFQVEDAPSLFADLPAGPEHLAELSRKNFNRLMQQIIHDAPPPPRTVNASVPRPLEQVCLKALCKDKEQRYAGAGAVAEEIEHWLADEPIGAWSEPVTLKMRRWMRRHRTLMTGAAALLVAAVPLLSILFVRSENARANLEVEQGRTKDALALAITNERLADERRIEADERRAEMERSVLQARFDLIFFKSREDPGLAMAATANLLSAASRLKNQDVLESMQLHLGSWNREVHRLRWVRAWGSTYIACSPDGQFILTGGGSDNRAAQQWESATGKPRGPPLRHQGRISAVAFNPDGTMVLTASLDKTARLWDAVTGKPLGAPLLHATEVVKAVFSPDGKIVLTGTSGGTACLWETATGKPLGPHLQHKSNVVAIAFSPDGKTVLTGSLDKTARLWETATGKPIGPSLQHQADVWAAVFSPDGNAVLTGSDDQTARLWKVPTGTPIGTQMQHQGRVRTVAFSPDGKIALTGSDDNTARLWDAETGTPLSLPLQHLGFITSVAFSPDGQKVLTASLDASARVWDTKTGMPVGQPLKHRNEGAVWAIFHPDGKSVLTGGWDDMARLWDLAADKSLLTLRHEAPVNAGAFSPDSRTVLTGGWGQSARMWDADTGKPRGPRFVQKSSVASLAISRDGKTVLTGSFDKTARLWEAVTGKPIGPPLQHEHWVVAVAFSPDGKTVLTGSLDKTARLWEMATGKPLAPPLQHQGSVDAVAFSPDGKTVLTGSWDKTARLWETATGKLIGAPLQHLTIVRSVAFHPDGKAVLTGCEDGVARLWDAATGKLLGTTRQRPGAVKSVAFHRDGKILATGSFDRSAQLWEVATRKALGPPMQHQGIVGSVAFSPDGRTVLTSVDKTARLWKVPQPLIGGPERVLLWTQVITGIAIDERDDTRVLDAAEWRQRRQRLQELGDPPES